MRVWGRQGLLLWLVIAAVVALVVAVAPVVGPSAWAQGDEPTTTTPAPDSPAAGAAEAGAAEAELAIIMDASSSMLQPDEGGNRLDVAKRAATELVDSLPGTAQVGMLAYGTQVTDAPENHVAGCEDIRTLASVGAVDKDRLRTEIDGLQAKGYTPIGNSLRAAADELSPEASERAIVLVSDGIDTCAPPPVCEVASELADQGVGLAVHVVGFRADEATRAELECIAEATGGTYRQADDAAALTESLKFLAQRAIVSYETTGTEFEFADTPEDAMYLGRGLYRTTLDAATGTSLGASPEHYIRIGVPEGHRAWVTLTPLPTIDLGAEAGGGQSINSRIEAVNDSHHSCDPASDISQNVGGGFEPPGSSVINFGPDNRGARGDQGDTAEGCDGSQWLLKAQLTSSFRGQSEPAELELSVQFEPTPGNESGTWPEGDAGEKYEAAPVDTAAAQPVVGGNSFSNAAAIGEGAFSDAIVPGEFRYYRLPVGWGQRPVVTLRTGPSARDAADKMYVNAYGPMRDEVAGGWVSFYEDATEETFAVDRPINYLNREANAGGAARALAGEHYIAVSMNVTGNINGVEQPFELGVRLEGEPGPGPSWAPVNVPGPEPSSSSIPVNDGAPGGDPGGNPGDDDNTSSHDSDTDQVAAGDDGSISTTVWLALGGAVLLLIVVGAVLARLLRGPKSEQP